MADGEIVQLSTREVYRSAWMSVREDEVRFPTGRTGTFSVVDKQDFVTVLPWTGDGFWLVQQFRYPVGVRAWEFPQGGWPAGHTGTSEQLAAAELREETGFTASALTRIGRLFAGYGYSSQSFDVYLATGLVAGEAQREDTEADMVHEWRSDAELRGMLRRGEFPDAHSVAALTLFDLARGDGLLPAT